jgi:carbon monoxide dehydrogenase subunit G
VELTHCFTVPAPAADTWALFDDIGAVATCFPGAAIESAEGDRCEGSAKIKLGPIAVQYKGTATVVERDEGARRIVIRAGGRDKRGQGTADATLTIAMAPDDGTTAVDVATTLAITGKPAQFGRGMIQDVSDTYLAQFVENVSQRLASAAEPARNGAAHPPEVEIDVGRMALAGVARRNAGALVVAGLALALLAVLMGRGRS